MPSTPSAAESKSRGNVRDASLKKKHAADPAAARPSTAVDRRRRASRIALLSRHFRAYAEAPFRHGAVLATCLAAAWALPSISLAFGPAGWFGPCICILGVLSALRSSWEDPHEDGEVLTPSAMRKTAELALGRESAARAAVSGFERAAREASSAMGISFSLRFLRGSDQPKACASGSDDDGTVFVSASLLFERAWDPDLSTIARGIVAHEAAHLACGDGAIQILFEAARPMACSAVLLCPAAWISWACGVFLGHGDGRTGFLFGCASTLIALLGYSAPRLLSAAAQRAVESRADFFAGAAVGHDVVAEALRALHGDDLRPFSWSRTHPPMAGRIAALLARAERRRARPAAVPAFDIHLLFLAQLNPRVDGPEKRRKSAIGPIS